MIVALLSDPYLRTVVGHAARPDEDVVYDPVLASAALEWGFPRLVIHSGVRAFTFDGPRSDLPVLALDRALMRSWEVDRLGLEGAGSTPRLPHRAVFAALWTSTCTACPGWTGRWLT